MKELFRFFLWRFRDHGHRLDDPANLGVLEGGRGWEGRLGVWGQVEAQDEGVCVPALEVQEASLAIDPADGQALQGIDGFWVIDADAVILVLGEILDAGRADVHGDGGESPVGVRAADGTRGSLERARVHVKGTPELIDVEVDDVIEGKIDEGRGPEDVLTGVPWIGRTGEGAGEGRGVYNPKHGRQLLGVNFDCKLSSP